MIPPTHCVDSVIPLNRFSFALQRRGWQTTQERRTGHDIAKDDPRDPHAIAWRTIDGDGQHNGVAGMLHNPVRERLQ